MALNFPDSPITGERYLAENGVEYIYDAANDTWTGSVDGIISPANPTPTDISAVPDFDSGTGTEQDPYVLTPICVLTPGAQATSKQLITIANQPAFSKGTWDVINGPVSRFDQPDAIFSGGGIWSGNILYDDTPTTTTAQLYDGMLQIGTAFIRWKVTQTVNVTTFTPADSPNASPATVDYATDLKYGTVTGTYADTPGELTATGAARFTINGGSPLTTGTIAAGDTLGVLFDETTVNAAAEAAVLEGHIHGQGSYCLVPTMTVVRSAEAFTVPPLVDAGVSTAVDSESFQLDAITCRTHLLLVSSGTTLTSVEASINGGTFAEVKTSGTDTPINPGDNIIVRGTTGSVNLLEYTASLKVGTTVGTWSVTTSDVAASITQPSIVSPVNGSVGIVPPLTLLGSTYLPLNGAGTHASSDWQVYEADLTPPSTSVITVVDEQLGLWTAVDGAEAQNQWFDVAYGGGKFVAVSKTGYNQIMYSTVIPNAYFGTGSQSLRRSSNLWECFLPSKVPCTRVGCQHLMLYLTRFLQSRTSSMPKPKAATIGSRLLKMSYGLLLNPWIGSKW